MEFIRIFGGEVNVLAVKFKTEDADEFGKAFDSWHDVEYLEDFFERNKSDFDFYDITSIDHAIERTRKEAQALEDELSLCDEGKRKLFDIFKPLRNNEFIFEFPLEVKGRLKPGWLRLYALEVEPDVYVITGGAIKLTLHMEREHLQSELDKLKRVKKYMKDNGFTDLDALIECE